MSILNDEATWRIPLSDFLNYLLKAFDIRKCYIYLFNY